MFWSYFSKWLHITFTICGPLSLKGSSNIYENDSNSNSQTDSNVTKLEKCNQMIGKGNTLLNKQQN